MQSNYEKAKEEGIKEYREKFPTLSFYGNASEKNMAMAEELSGKFTRDDRQLPLDIESFLSSFAEKIKEGVEKDNQEKVNMLCSLQVRESSLIPKGQVWISSSDSQTIK